MRMKWNVVLGIVISMTFVLVIFHQVDLTKLTAAIQSVNAFPLILAAVLLIFTHLIRSWRWRYLMEPVKPMSIQPLFSAISIGFLANMLLPAHAGEVVRAYVISRKERVSTIASLATVVVARVADFVSILLILIILLNVMKLPEEMASVSEKLRVGGYLSVLIGVILVSGLWLMMARTVQTIHLIRVCVAFLPVRWLDRLSDVLTSFSVGLQALKKGHHMVAIFVLSLFLWTVVGLSNMLVLHAFNLQLPVYAAFLILIVQTLGVLIPSAPGFIGTYHAAVIASLAVFGVVHELALSVALVMHATFFFPFIIVGLIFLWKESLSLHELWSVKAQGLK